MDISIHIFVLKYVLNDSQSILKSIFRYFFHFLAIFDQKMRFLAILERKNFGQKFFRPSY